MVRDSFLWVLVASSADLSSGGEGWVSNGEPQNVGRGTHILVPARAAAERNEGIQPINRIVKLKKEDAIYLGAFCHLTEIWPSVFGCLNHVFFFFIFTDFQVIRKKLHCELSNIHGSVLAYKQMICPPWQREKGMALGTTPG